MSDEQRKDEEAEVEAHSLQRPARPARPAANEEPTDEAEVEAHSLQRPARPARPA